MKVLIVSNSIGFWRGGHARNIMFLVQALKTKGVDVHLLTANILDEGVFQSGVPITQVDIGKYSLISFAQAVADHLSSQTYDLVHSNGPAIYKYLAATKKEKRTPVVFHARSSNLVNGISSLLDPYAFSKPISLKQLISPFYEFWFDFKVLRSCDHVFINCKDVLNRLDRTISIASKATVLHNGILLENEMTFEGSKLAKREGKLSSPTVIGYLANHHLLKGWKYFASIIKEMLAQGGFQTFILAGDGPLHYLIQQDLRDYVDSGQVIFTGRISDREAKNAFFESLDLYVCPAHAPTTVLEALSYQLPVLWLSRWQDCANGIDVEPFVDIGWMQRHRNLSVQDAAQVLKQFEANNLSAAQLQECMLSEYSWERIAEKAIAVYQDIASRK